MPIVGFVVRVMVSVVLLCVMAIVGVKAIGRTQPAGSAIVYSEFNGGPGSTLKVTSIGGFPGTPIWKETLFSARTRHFADYPACSPDGNRIAFSSNHLDSVGGYSDPDALGGYQLYVMDTAGNNVEPLTEEPDAYNINPRWSPDGSQIVFGHAAPSDPTQRVEFYIMNMMTGETRSLVGGGAWYRDPSWSPDGEQIVFSALPINQGTNTWHLYIINLTGGSPIPLISESDTNFRDPSWSPDGSQIVLSIDSEPSEEVLYPSGIYIMDADGNHLTQLTTMRGFSPSFSPDGQRIAFAAIVNDQSDIYVMNSDGNNIQQITYTPYEDEASPCWLP
jgi:TolB protein